MPHDLNGNPDRARMGPELQQVLGEFKNSTSLALEREASEAMGVVRKRLGDLGTLTRLPAEQLCCLCVVGENPTNGAIQMQWHSSYLAPTAFADAARQSYAHAVDHGTEVVLRHQGERYHFRPGTQQDIGDAIKRYESLQVKEPR